LKVLIIGGCGYIGSVLTPLLVKSHHVTTYDMLHMQDVRSTELFRRFCEGKDAVIYLAAMSNNDWYEKNLLVGDDINRNCFPAAIDAAKRAGVKRFIYASSVAAYGSSDKELNEDDVLNPSTLYGHAKVYCENWILANQCNEVTCTVTRSASVCGWSPRMRNDLTVNKMVHDAMTEGVITVNGGDQVRSHVHILDLCDFYALLLEAPIEKIAGQAFNVVFENHKVADTARMVANIIGSRIVTLPYTDDRSYAVCGKKAQQVLGWMPKRTIADAVKDIKMIHHHAHA
jgi:nucleoside-diphosphate-sugar epimerase